MTLSILIPAYNPGKWLRGILDSLKAQIERHPDVEIIIVDDGSTEDLAWVVDYPKVRYIRQANGREANARNALLREAAGEFIQFIDADDEIYPNCLDVVFDNIEHGYDFVTYEFETDHDRKRSYHNYGQLMVNCAMWGYTLRKMLTEGQWFDETLPKGCDVDFLRRVLREDARHKHDDRVFYNYRFDGNTNSICHRLLRGESV